MLLAVPEDERKGGVFDLPQKDGSRPSCSTEVSRKVSSAGKLAEIKFDEQDGKVKHASAHDLRLAFRVRWSRRIFPVDLMELMRCEHRGTTMKYYVGQQAELTADKLYEAIERENAGQV